MTFLHGFALDGRMWSAEAVSLESTHRTLVVDLPGFGPNGALCAGAPCAADAVLEVLDARGIERTHLVGHSFGGAVAVDFALAFPARVLTLTLVDALLLGWPAGIVAWRRCAELAREGKLAEARRAWLGDPLFETSRRSPRVVHELKAMVDDYGCGHWSGRVSPRWRVEEPAARLREIAAPALVVVGALDTPNFRAMATAHAKLPNAHAVAIPDAGHVCPLESPSAVHEALRARLA